METNLYYFTIVADEMSMTKAANRLFISQQALSKHISSLEKEYNLVLFERNPRLRLTVAGEHLLEYARNVLAMEQDVLHTINDPGTLSQIKLPYGISSKKGHMLVPLVLPRFRELYPNVLPSVYEGTKEYLDMMLSQGRIDLYFKMGGRESQTGKFLPMHNDELYFIVSRTLLENTIGTGWKDYLYEHRNGVDVSEISRFPLMFPNEGSSLYETLRMYFRKYPLQIVGEMNNYPAVLKSVYLGYCGGFESKLFYYDFVSRSPEYSENTYPLRITDIEGISQFGAVYDPASEKKKHLMDFIELSKQATRELEKRTEEHLYSVRKKLESFK